MPTVINKLMLAAMVLLSGVAFAQQTGGGGGVPGGNTGGGTTTNPATFNNSGTGAASGATFNGSAAQTISYNTIGAAPASGGTLTPKIINGRSISCGYPGSSLDARVVAAQVDALALSNGNTTGIIDSNCEGGSQSILAPFTLGNGTNTPIVWLLPGTCAWSVSGLNTSTPAITMDGNVSIIGPAHNWNSCVISDNSTLVGSLLATSNSGSGYYKAEGFMLFNSSQTTSSGAVWQVTNSDDTTDFSNISVFNGAAGISSLKVAGGSTSVCCATNFHNIQLNSNSTGGILLDVESSASGGAYAVNFYDSTFTHPQSGQPAVKLHDTSTTRTSQASFYGGYIETNLTDTTTALIQIDGFGQVGIFGFQIQDPYTTSTATGITVTNTFPTSLVVADYTQFAGFTYPSVAIVNSATGTTVHTDASSAGHLSLYSSGVTTVDGGLSVTGIATLQGIAIGGSGINGVAIGAINPASIATTQLNFRVTTVSGTTPSLNAGAVTETITLSGNSTPTMSGISSGAYWAMQICQPATGGPYTWTWPASVHVLAADTTAINIMAASTCAQLTFESFSGTTLVETSAKIGIAP